MAIGPYDAQKHCPHSRQSNGLWENLNGPQVAYTMCDDCGKVLYRSDQQEDVPLNPASSEGSEQT